MHIAELNIGKLRYPPEDPRMDEFIGNLARINALAERSPGFVWRLQGDGDGAIDIFHPDHPDTNVNLSVWETVEDLEAYVFNTVHVRFYAKKDDWFDHVEQPAFAMWPVPVGHIPDVFEAWERLEHLRAHGPTDHAYGWEALPHLKDWMEKRCA